MTLRAINNIRDSHFQGGTKADQTKGLFLPSVTNKTLSQIYDAGLSDASAWKLNSSGYYEKTFPYANVGLRSEKCGNSLPSTQVTIVVERYGANGYNEVVTMYPADK
ncbi:hypothetical protein ACIHAA_19085 [Streptomyces sp. NPDC052040]|uniref:hypothetical protein n=1 Tax=Streptomyces sp. NPDC052040 TaxID=3365682 RepID=UPI0037D12A53